MKNRGTATFQTVLTSNILEVPINFTEKDYDYNPKDKTDLIISHTDIRNLTSDGNRKCKIQVLIKIEELKNE